MMDELREAIEWARTCELFGVWAQKQHKSLALLADAAESASALQAEVDELRERVRALRPEPLILCPWPGCDGEMEVIAANEANTSWRLWCNVCGTEGPDCATKELARASVEAKP